MCVHTSRIPCDESFGLGIKRQAEMVNMHSRQLQEESVTGSKLIMSNSERRPGFELAENVSRSSSDDCQGVSSRPETPEDDNNCLGDGPAGSTVTTNDSVRYDDHRTPTLSKRDSVEHFRKRECKAVVEDSKKPKSLTEDL